MSKMENDESSIVPFARSGEHYSHLSPGEYVQLDPRKGYGDVAWAAVGCPLCGKILLVMHKNHTVDSLGTVEPEMLCVGRDGRRCTFNAIGYFEDWHPQTTGRA